MSSQSKHFNGAPKCPGRLLTRRDFIKSAAISTAAIPLKQLHALQNPQVTQENIPKSSLTTIGLCKRYEFAAVRRILAKLLDELDVRQIVKNQHVTIKVNLVNSSQENVCGVPLGMTVTVHPVVAMALGNLLVDFGAKHVVFCDQLPFRPLNEEGFIGYGFKLPDFKRAMKDRVSFVNTRNRGKHSTYAWVKTPGAELANAWEVNRAYVDTDVLISLAKLKSHVSGGISAGMKNLFGIPPSSLYGDDLDKQPDESATGYRNAVMHNCTRQPFTSAGSFNGKSVEGDHGFNVPRFIVDLNSAFPISLTVIDGISIIQTAEGWWNGSMVSITRPGLLIAGLNPVSTDAVAASIMGFDPDAPDRSWPFVNGTNYLALARRKGMGENRINKLEIAGVDLEAARFECQPTYRRKAF